MIHAVIQEITSHKIVELILFKKTRPFGILNTIIYRMERYFQGTTRTVFIKKK